MFDAIIDVPGDTDIQCGPSQELLLFQHGNGFDQVFGFDPSDTGDVIAIEANVNGTGLASVDQISVSDTEAGALVDLGGGNGLLLVGVGTDQLDESDLVIHPEISPAPAIEPPAPEPPAPPAPPVEVPSPDGGDIEDLWSYYDAWYGAMGPSFVVI